MNNINWLIVTLNVLTGLILFLYGVTCVSDGLKVIGSDKMKLIVGKSANTIFTGIITGFIATTLLHSSSVVIIMLISMINAQLLTAKQSYGIILGSNIGSSIGSQIIAFNVGEYSAVLLFIGFITAMVAKKESIKNIGKSILGVGLIFFGLYYMSDSVEPLKSLESFTTLMTKIDNPFKGAMIGAIATLLIQSSSATVAILISLANQNLISFFGAISVMLGAEIGTCSDTLLATIGRSRDSLRAGIFHLFFSITSALIVLLLLKPFTDLVNLISGDSSTARHIANAHVLFNLLGVLLFVGFVPLLSKMLLRLIPEKLKN